MNGLLVVLLIMVGLVVAIWVFYEFILGSERAHDRHQQRIAKADLKRQYDLGGKSFNEGRERMREAQLSTYRQAEISREKEDFKRYLDGLK